ncbi:hypothetical protein [Vandammella animalimorsus]|uniref:hypothetical protein n=1 Tax=Vandammella animalimorsus TaxID=2029117 RepID=UPI0015CDBE63|nr:hypothetical protein [Vandammella animalimorsus]
MAWGHGEVGKATSRPNPIDCPRYRVFEQVLRGALPAQQALHDKETKKKAQIQPLIDI